MLSAIHHLDLVVTSLDRSLPFCQELLGWTESGDMVGEQRYGVGVHHVAFQAGSREAVEERFRWLRSRGTPIESEPREHDHSPGYFAVFFYDPDGLKLEIVHQPREEEATA